MTKKAMEMRLVVARMLREAFFEGFECLTEAANSWPDYAPHPAYWDKFEELLEVFEDSEQTQGSTTKMWEPPV